MVVAETLVALVVVDDTPDIGNETLPRLLVVLTVSKMWMWAVDSVLG